MSRKDALTGRVAYTGNNRSKALNITKRDWKFNVQKRTFKDKNGKSVTIVASVKSLRTIRKKGLLRDV